MTAQEVLVNIRGFSNYELSHYPLCEAEAEVIIEALELMIEKERSEKNEKVIHAQPQSV